MTPWTPSGTVYGTLLNFRREWDLWSARMAQDPHKAAPKAPVLYVKTANTFCPAGQDLLLQDGVVKAYGPRDQVLGAAARAPQPNGQPVRPAAVAAPGESPVVSN